MRQMPPKVVTILAGGICRDFSPVSLMMIEGQQLSTQPVVEETTVSEVMEPQQGADT